MLSSTVGFKKQKSKERLQSKTSENLFLDWLWHISGLTLIVLVSSYASYGGLNIPLKALPMVVMVGLLYISLLFNRSQVKLYRSYQTIGISFFYMVVGYMTIFTVLAMLRLYFSRSFLVTGFVLTAVFIVGGILLSRKSNPFYFVIKGGAAQALKNHGLSGWEYQKGLSDDIDLSAYDSVVVDLHAHNDQELLKKLADSTLKGVPIRHAAAVFENYSGRTHLDYIAEEGFYDLVPSRASLVIKRFLEISLIVLALPVVIPFALLMALAIKIDSRGPVFFTQSRVGRNGEEFTLYKFRSMTTDAEKEGAQFADESDDRVTLLGKFIRKFRIDEIPQFWNVLKGDMSLIGPRPEQQDFVQYFDEEIPFYTYRHKVRPGITGWAQIKDGYAADLESTERKLEFDLYYIKNLSLSLDLLIIYATVKTILTGFGSR